MGLDTSHNAWHGAYSAFMRWREKIAQVAGLPPLGLMEGFFEKGNYTDPFKDYAQNWPTLAEAFYESCPIKWDCLKPDPIHKLLHHSDCDGEIAAEDCGPIADSLERLIPLLPQGEGGGHIGNWRDKTQQFVTGLRAAAAAGEPLHFG
jgi:hypothetical protein